MNASQSTASSFPSRKNRAHLDAEECPFTIGDLAKEFGVSLRTLRFYEDRGLLRPHRHGNARFYSESERARLRLILLGKEYGFSLLEIKAMIKETKGPSKETILDMSPEFISNQIAHLERQKQQMAQSIDHLRATLHLKIGSQDN